MRFKKSERREKDAWFLPKLKYGEYCYFNDIIIYYIERFGYVRNVMSV